MQVFQASRTGVVNLVGVRTSINLAYRPRGEIHVTFTFMRIVYTFEFKSFSGRGTTQFLETFFEIERDQNVFGRFGSTGLYEGDADKIQNCRLVAIVDAFKTLDLITTKYQRSTIEYAIWFRETGFKHSQQDYGDYIAKMVCHCIVHQSFTQPDFLYDVVKLEPGEYFNPS